MPESRAVEHQCVPDVPLLFHLDLVEPDPSLLCQLFPDLCGWERQSVEMNAQVLVVQSCHHPSPCSQQGPGWLSSDLTGL